MKIRIGADELILWLRKNRKAMGISTPELGKRILNLMETIGGERKEEEDCRWERSKNAEGIDKLDLPKTATQYEVSVSKMSELYAHLTEW